MVCCFLVLGSKGCHFGDFQIQRLCLSAILEVGCLHQHLVFVDPVCGVNNMRLEMVVYQDFKGALRSLHPNIIFEKC